MTMARNETPRTLRYAAAVLAGRQRPADAASPMQISEVIADVPVPSRTGSACLQLASDELASEAQ